MTGCRIGHIRLKSGGSITLMPGKRFGLVTKSENEDIECVIRETLRQAGDMQSIAIVHVVKGGNGIKTNWAALDGVSYAELIGGVSMLHNDLIKWVEPK